MAIDESGRDAAMTGAAGSSDLSRIRGMDSAAGRILTPLLQRLEDREKGLVVPFLLHLPGADARAAFRDLPPIEGETGNGAMVLGGEAAAALTGGAFLAAIAPPEWFARLADKRAERCPLLAAFRDVEKTIQVSEPGRLTGWLERLAWKLPALLSWSEASAAASHPEGTVVVGVIDDGIAIAHERFRHADGTSRVACYWDQNKFLTNDQDIKTRRNYSSSDLKDGPLPGELPKARIDEVLEEVPPDGDEDLIYQRLGIIDFREEEPEFVAHRTSHGTHVADLATGYDPRDPKAALRPIIAVQMPNPVIALPVDDCRLDFYIWLGIIYIVVQADRLEGRTNGLPVVINASFGKLAGPHDGTGLIERAIDALVISRDQRTQVVLPAGNQQLSQCHAIVDLERAESVAFEWEVLPDDRTCSTVQIWLPEGEPESCSPRMRLELHSPYGGKFDFNDAQQAPVPIRHLGEAAGTISLESNDLGRAMIRIDIGPTAPNLYQPSEFELAPSGTWKLRFIRGDAPIRAHVWCQRDDTLHGYPQTGRQSYFGHERYRRFAESIHPQNPDGDLSLIDSDEHPEQRDFICPITRTHLLNALATGAEVLVAGSHIARTGRIAPYSAGGPTTPGNASQTPARRPDLTFPCEDSPVLGGVLAAGSRSGTAVTLGGTSVAAPQLTRLTADLLGQQAEAKLARIRELLADSMEATSRNQDYSAFSSQNRGGLGQMRRACTAPGPEARGAEDN
jgi:hypothetical protein